MVLERQKYVGFYWTYPVGYVGFTELPGDIDEAAQASQTIRYQRNRVLAWVAGENGALIYEHTFMELDAGHASEHILDDLNTAIAIARRHSADLVTVDFSEAHGWRPHMYLERALHSADVNCHVLDPEAIRIEGQKFDPVAHFRAWNEQTQAHIKGKDEHRNKILALLSTHHGDHLTFAGLADMLNDHGHKTHTGKNWTADNLRKFLK